MSLNHQKYHAFAIKLSQLRSDLIAKELDALQLRQYTTSLQQFFQQEIIPLAEEDTNSPDLGQVQSYLTEMSKQLRLLGIDVTFFQAARQASTVQQRVDTISDRLATLIEYCHAIVRGV